jgi:peptidoglycan/LPS O-acetylase OafA/YrhL
MGSIALLSIQFIMIESSGINDNLFSSPFFGVNTVAKEFLSILTIYFLSKFTDQELLETDLLSKLFSLLAELSFGIYFIHDYVLRGYFLIVNSLFLHKSWLVNGSLISILVASFVVTVSSILFLLMSKKILMKQSRYILGC